MFFGSKFFLNFRVKMSKRAKETLSAKLKKSENIIQGVKQSTKDESKSPYFSPRKTRNKVKVEYEKDNDPKKIAKKDTEKEKPKPVKSKLKIEPEKVADEPSPKKQPWEPKDWKEILKNIRTMRESCSAPVDEMGCDKCSDENADDKTQRYHTLVALMLSSQTKDQVTYDAMNRLKAKGLTPIKVVDTDVNELAETLKPVSFYKNKAKYIKNTAQILIDQYDSDIPKTVEELIKLPGVGPKMAHICMNSAWDIVSGIGVDVHVHRIANRLKWLRKETKTPEQTRADLEDWLPYDLWSDVNHLLVGFGQTICTPVNPKCDTCLNNKICPSANLKKIKKK